MKTCTIRRAPLLVVCLLGTACGADPANSGETAAEQPVDLGELEQALSSHERCDTANEHVLVSGSFSPSWTTDAQYGTRLCHAAYLVNLINYTGASGESAGGAQGADWAGENLVTFAEAAPTTEAECEKLRIGVYVWEYPNGWADPFPGAVTAYLGNRWVWGSWESGVCTVPEVVIGEGGPFHLTHGGTYRIAASARLYAEARNTGSRYARRPLAFSRVVN